MTRFAAADFTRAPVDCARELIGAVLEWDGCRGRIVETEAYAAADDPACHTFFRPSAREFVARESAGTAYVYLNYGVHWMFNLLVKGAAGDGFVLVRALEPLEGLELMRRRRKGRADRELCAGPGRLTQALGIGRADHARPFLDHASRGLVAGERGEIVADGRVGISRGGDLPWRFTEKDNRFVSRKPR